MNAVANEAMADLRACANEIRAGVLSDLEAQRALSPIGFARTHGVPVENIAYHFRVLRERGLIRLVRTIPVRGAVEHEYVMTDRGRRALRGTRRLLQALAPTEAR